MTGALTDRQLDNLREFITRAWQTLLKARAATFHCPTTANVKAEERAEDAMNRWLERWPR